MNRRQLNLAALVAVGAAAAAGGFWIRRRKEGVPAGDQLWSAKFDTPAGTPLAMASFYGKPLVLNFWATWCAPCVKEMPQLDRFHREYAAQGWQVLGLAIDNANAVKGFLAKVPVAFPIALAGMEGADLGRTLGNLQGGLPFTAVFDAKGTAVHHKSGETSYEELVGWVRQFG